MNIDFNMWLLKFVVLTMSKLTRMELCSSGFQKKKSSLNLQKLVADIC